MFRQRWRWLAVVALLLVAGVVVLRQPLSRLLWSGSQLQALLAEGDAALRAGRLSAPDGSGARQKFEAAQALDNDRSEARAGLARVANAALGQARQALARGDLGRAAEALQLARELQAPGAQVAAVAEELRQRQVASAGLGQWLQQAAAAAAAGRLDGGPEAALPLYQRVLALQPGHTEALEGREDALSDLLAQARSALAGGDLLRGAALVDAAQGYDPGHVQLPESRAALSRAIDAHRQQAERLLRQRRLPQALEAFRALQAAAPDAGTQAAAAQGIERIALAYAAQARAQAADFEFTRAEASLAAARDAAPQLAEVRDATQYLQRVRQSQSRRDLAVTPQVRREVARLLAEMEQAEARGQWMTPPGDSAYDKLRAAQALAPREPAVVAAARRLLPASQRCFEAELRSNRPRAASACLDAWASLSGGNAGLASARRRLAAAWVAVGSERMNAGDLAYAREAVQRAAVLDGNAPGLAELRSRVAGARLR